MSDRLECINCGGSVSLSDPEFCPTCLWLVRGQLIDCVTRLLLYLKRHDQFEAWCAQHARVAA